MNRKILFLYKFLIYYLRGLKAHFFFQYLEKNGNFRSLFKKRANLEKKITLPSNL